MSKNPPSRSYAVASPRFWRNVTLIALAHLALIAGLIRWSVAARSAPDAESLVWLSGAEDLAAGRSESGAAAPTKVSVPSAESESLGPDEREREQPPLTQAKSEIELPKPTPMETPVPKATAKPKTTPKPIPKPIPKSTPKKTVLAKASKSPAHPKSSPPKSTGDQSDASNEKKKSVRTAGAKAKSSSDNGGEKTGSAGKGDSVRQGTDSPGRADGGTSASEFGWYGNMLHDRFYSAWIQPTTTVASGAKISTLVKVRIEKDGRVSKFEIIKRSEIAVVNESVAVVAKQVTQVDPPPAGLATGDHYDVKINFELNTGER
jgi:outer membrane biosynthesis protein TonB